MKTLQEMIEEAKLANACSNNIELVSKYSTIEEASEDPDAPFWCYWYADRVVGGRVPELEYIIAKELQFSYNYAVHILKGRFIEGEEIIKTSPISIYYYACYVIKERWPEVEHILKESACWNYYVDKLIFKNRKE